MANVQPIEFEQLVAEYQNTADHNDYLVKTMTEATWSNPILAPHRKYFQTNRLGFGDPCFHSMWLTLMCSAQRRFGRVRALEIGVFKGQVISLWALIAKHWGIDLQISGITPLMGNPRPKSRLKAWLRYRLDPRFREQTDNANFHEMADYASIIRENFRRFDVDFESVVLHKGFSTDKKVVEDLANETFHIVYVDGDHTYDGALHDFTTFGSKVVKGGWLVADDAGCSLPGNDFWKGLPAVSQAAEHLLGLGFRNVLNVGHNRIYQRVDEESGEKRT
jgi:hypothetical protein